MALNYKFEFLFDSGKAERAVEEVAKHFVDAFNNGKPFEGSKKDFEQFIGYTNRRLIELRAKYKETQDALRKSGGSLADNPQLEVINKQIEGVRKLRAEAKKAYSDIAQPAQKIDLGSIFQSARNAQGSSDDITAQIRTLENDLQILKATLKETKDELESKGMSPKTNSFFTKLESDVAATEAELNGYKARLKEVKEEEKKLADEEKKRAEEQKKLQHQLAASSAELQKSFVEGRGFSGTNLQLKQAIADTSTELRKLKAQYQETLASIQREGSEEKDNPALTALKDNIDETNAKLQGLRENWKERRMSSENMFQGVAQGAQGLMGAFTAAQGAAAMFGAEEEKLQKIQTKLQASMSILMGLQRAGNALQSTSQFRVQVLNKLQEAYHKWNLKVAASEGVKKAAMAGVVGVIALVIAGLTAAIIKWSKYADEVERARQLQKKFREEFANSATGQISTLARLQAEWKSINGEADKQRQFIAKYRSELDELGIAENNIAKVESGLFSDDTKQRIFAKARAMAYLAQMNALVAESMELQAKIEDTESRRPGKWGYFFYRLGASRSGGPVMSYDEYVADAIEHSNTAITEQQKEIDKKLDESLEKYMNEMAGITDQAGNRDWNQQQAQRAQAIASAQRSLIETIRKNAQEEIRTRENIQRQIVDAEIAAMEEGYEKEGQLRRLANRREIEDLERQREDYIESARNRAKAEFDAAEAVKKAQNDKYIPSIFDPNSVSVDTSYFDSLINAKKARQRAENRQRILAESTDFVRDYNKIWEDFNRKSEDLVYLNLDPDEYKRRLNSIRQTTEDSVVAFANNLASSFEDADFSEWAKKIQSLDLQDLQIELYDLETQLETFGNTEVMSEEDTVKLQAAIALLKRTIRDFNESGDLDTVSQKWTDWSNAIELTRQTFSDIGDNIGGTVGEIAKGIGTSISQFQSLRNAIESYNSSSATAADRMQAKMSIISTAISGTIQLIGIYVNSLEEAKKAEDEWQAKVRQTAHALNMLQLQELDYRQRNLFGVENPYSKAIAGATQYAAAVGKLNDMQAQWNEGQIQVETKRAVDWKNVWQGVGAGAAAGAAVGTAVGGWAAGLGTVIGSAIGAVTGLVVGLASTKVVPVFESLEDHYGALYDENYKLNQRLVADYDKLDDATKQIVDNWDEIVEKMKEAEEQMRENFRDLAGDLGDNLSDALVAAFRSGKIDTALKDFKGSVNGTLESILQQQVFAAIFQDIFDNLESEMMASFKQGGDYDLVDDIMRMDSAWQERLGAYDAQMKSVQDYYKQQGYDLWNDANQRTAATKAISGVSQESFDDALGRFTAIQSHTYELNETTKTLREQQGNLLVVTSQILYEVQGIHRDTERMQESLDTMQGDMTLVRSGVAQMTDKGVRMLN